MQTSYFVFGLFVTFAAVSVYSAEKGSGGTLLVANKGDHTIGFIDPETGKQVATADAGGITPHEVIASPDGRTVYAPIYGNSGVGKPGTDGTNLAVIDAASHKVVG